MYVVSVEQCAMSNLHKDSLELAKAIADKITNKQPVDLLDVLKLTSYVKSAFDKSPVEFGDHDELNS